MVLGLLRWGVRSCLMSYLNGVGNSLKLIRYIPPFPILSLPFLGSIDITKLVWLTASSLPTLQILGCCVLSLRTKDPVTCKVTTIDDLAEVRRICHRLQSKVLRSPETVYAHRWEESDLVIFHNWGVWHSITGQLGDGNSEDDRGRRSMWQCTLAGSQAPLSWRSSHPN